MPNAGPSKGCRNCKVRKIKCDETQPACQRCVKSRLVCAGRESFRDLTWITEKRSSESRRRKGSNKSADHDEANFTKANLVVRQPQHRPEQLVPSISLHPEQKALNFLFSHFLPLVPGYYIDDLPTTYAKSSASSALSAATAANALSYMSLHPHYAQLKHLALEKYKETLRLIREGLNDKDTAATDEFLMAVLLLGMFECSRYLALEFGAHALHTRGAIALIKARAPSSFSSDLSRKLVRQVRAELIYISLLNSTSPLLHNHQDPMKFRFESDAEFRWEDSDLFCALAERVAGNVAVLQRSQILHKRPSGPSQQAELKTLLEDANREDATLRSWPHALPNDSCKTCAVTLAPSDASRFHPQRILCYDNAPQAGIYMAWRICRIRMLDIVSRAYDLLACHYREENREQKKKIDETITYLVNDICSSIPFYLGWPDQAGENRFRSCGTTDIARPMSVTGIEIIANWSQLMPVIWAASSLACVPVAQREWLGEYLTLLSNDPRKVFSLSFFDGEQRFAWLDEMSCYDDVTEKTSPS